MEEEQPSEVTQQVAAFPAAWFRTRQTVMEANFHRAHQQGLSTTQFMLLNLLERDVVWTLRKLATALHLEPASLAVAGYKCRWVRFHTRLTVTFEAMRPDERQTLVARLEAFANAATVPQKELSHESP